MAATCLPGAKVTMEPAIISGNWDLCAITLRLLQLKSANEMQPTGEIAQVFQL
jgi:hypothetical protein